MKLTGKGHGDEPPGDEPPDNDPLRWLKWGALVVLVLLAFALVAVTIATAQDSTMVHIEEDPDGDGFYQIQYTYKDRVGVWGVPGQGRMRVMYEVAPGVMHTDWYAVSFSAVGEVVADTVFVDLTLFGEFGMSFGQQTTVLVDGTLVWDSPGGRWYYVPRP